MYVFEVIFCISLIIIVYTYIGYGILLWFLVKIKELIKSRKYILPLEEFPEVTLFIPAYNEKDYVDEKVRNCRNLKYPKEKLKIVWVTDGSDDGTPELLQQYPDIIVYHQSSREGKIMAMNRGMRLITSPIVVFSDANTLLGEESIERIVRLFADPKVGCVSGEKRILSKDKDMAAGAGEGLYWKYESFLKKYDARLYSVVGAAGELFAIRREYFTEVEKDTILDDFIISLRIAMQGYVTQYDPEAYAYELPSADVREELKRKVRIAAGGIQSIVRLSPLLNIFRFGVLSFQYISHRVLRWTLAPLSLLFFLMSNFVLSFRMSFTIHHPITIVLGLQVCFYLLAFLGWFLEKKQLKYKVFFIPYYFFIMNLAVYLGFFRYIRKKQDAKWEKAKRRM
ncbi:MAG: glycosyltransferase family 2 protein [Bacteroidales bacterium]|jgi:cellulose synthase/poly-beta-1,6-N-acetylglucosamine synthase-like glycosyltransferase|nr:glycosyltransferase family 2 protein [Bacteroidales bacterium]